jgi:hypothetical protein
MLPNELAEAILEGHASKHRDILVIKGIRLELQLEYSGLMAGGAYQGYRKKWNDGRRKVGCFDFKIFDTSGPEEMPLVHRRVIEDALGSLKVPLVEGVFSGEDPFALSEDKRVRKALNEVQLTMLEQEVNWGDEVFQSKTYFLPSKNLRPRDFIMAYLRRGFQEPGFLGDTGSMRAASGTWGVLRPPIDKGVWSHYLEPKDSPARPWLGGELLTRFRAVADSMTDNPSYSLVYGD